MLVQILVALVFLIIMALLFAAVRKDRYRGGGTLGNALHEMQSAFDPGMRHTIAEEQKEQIEEDEAGELIEGDGDHK